MDRTQHHERAEQLLSDVRKEPDSFLRGLILAEAQVHATLALSAPAETSPPGQEQAPVERIVPAAPARERIIIPAAPASEITL